jgi:CHAD domain-containing protein
MKGLTQYARAMAGKRIAAVNRERLRLLSDTGEEVIHDFRVSIRRLEPVLDLFDIEPLGFDATAAQELAEAWLRAAGRVRDCDVVKPLFPEPYATKLGEVRNERCADLVRLLSGSGPMPGPRHWRRAALPVSEPEVLHFAALVLPHLARAYFRSGARAIVKKRSLRRLHEFRLHGKSLRYSLELFQTLYGGRMKSLQRMLKRMQLVLGEMADARAGLRLLEKFGAPDDVAGALRELAAAKQQEFALRWAEDVPDAKTADNWVEYLRRFARPEG